MARTIVALVSRAVAVFLFLASCTSAPNPPLPTPTLVPSLTETVAQPLATPQVFATRAQVIPTALQTSTTTRPAPTPTSTISGSTTRVKIFLIAIDDNGKSGKKIGCNDSAVPVERVIPRTGTPLRAALEELLNLRDRSYGQSGLYNVLYQSQLKVDSVTVVNTKATVQLSGAPHLGGVCDIPRVEAQIEQTALQFATVKSAEIFLNKIPLEKALSQK